MTRKHRVFLDTNALFAGIWSERGGGRVVLTLGASGLVTPLVSSQVLDEIERTVRAKAIETLPHLALLLHEAQVQVVTPPPAERVAACFELTRHQNDALVIAAAWHAAVDFFVTLDRQHFLSNQPLRRAAPFPIDAPGDFLTWFRAQWETG